MATITEDARVITINHGSYYTYAVVTPTVSVEFQSLEQAHAWLPDIAVRRVTTEVARAHSINKIKSLQISNPEFFKRGR